MYPNTDLESSFDWSQRVGESVLDLPFTEGLPSSEKAKTLTDWVLDQVARILHGTLVVVTLAKWNKPEYFQENESERYPYPYVDAQNGIIGEYRFNTKEEASQAYLDWVLSLKGAYDEENEEYEYDYSEGIAP